MTLIENCHTTHPSFGRAIEGLQHRINWAPKGIAMEITVREMDEKGVFTTRLTGSLTIHV